MTREGQRGLYDCDAGLADDLNTAVALAATFDFVREANIAMANNEFGQEDVAAAKRFLWRFDQVLAVVQDNDAEKLKELGFGAAEIDVSPADIDKKIEERQAARKRRDFARSDEIGR